MGHHVAFSLKGSGTPVSRKCAKEAKKKTISQVILTDGNFGKCRSNRTGVKHAHPGEAECVRLNTDVRECTSDT